MLKIVVRLLLGTGVGTAFGAAVAGAVLTSGAGSAVMEAIGGLGVLGTAFAGGIAASAVAPRKFEIIVAAVSVFGGSFIRLLAYGSQVGSQIAGSLDGGIVSLTTAFLADGGWLLISAVAGGWVVSRIRRKFGLAGYGGRLAP